MKRLAVAAACALALAGCSLELDFHECNQDSDCAARVGGPDGGLHGMGAYCTSDHICVADLPEERLCSSGTFGSMSPDIWVAGLFRLSGASGDKDTEMAQAAELAMGDIAGIAQGRKIGMVLCDTAFGQAARSLEKAIKDYHVVGAVGPTTSGDMLTGASGGPSSAEVAIANGILLVTPSATSPQITGLDDHGLIWRTAGSDNLQASTLAQLVPPTIGMTTPRATVVDTAYVSTAYGTGLDTAFVAELNQLTGLTPKATHQFDTGVDPMAVITDLSNDGPDYSLIVADDDAAAIVNALYGDPPGLSTTQFLLTDGAKGVDLLSSPNAIVAARIRGTAPANPSGPVFTVFQAHYENAYGTDPTATSFVANTYDAAWALALAVEGQPPGAVTGAGLSDAMSRMSASGATVYQVGRDFIAPATDLGNGATIDLDGTSGHLTWDGNGDVVDAPIEVWGIDTSTTPAQFCTFSPPPQTCP